MLSLVDFAKTIQDDGVAVFPSILSEAELLPLRRDVERAYEINRAIQKRNGVDYPGVAHHMIRSIWRDGCFASFLEHLPLRGYIDAYFGGPYILNTFSGLMNFKDGDTKYQNRPHRDMRSYYSSRLSLNVLVFLDAFTEENGATLYTRGSHLVADMPSTEDFYARAEQMLGPAGSIAVFNSDLVHSGGINQTDNVRRCLGFTVVRPFMKQQCEYSLLVTDSDSEWMKQILGYNARVSKDLNEWYQPVERRMYRMGQG